MRWSQVLGRGLGLEMLRDSFQNFFPQRPELLIDQTKSSYFLSIHWSYHAVDLHDGHPMFISCGESEESALKSISLRTLLR